MLIFFFSEFIKFGWTLKLLFAMQKLKENFVIENMWESLSNLSSKGNLKDWVLVIIFFLLNLLDFGRCRVKIINRNEKKIL